MPVLRNTVKACNSKEDWWSSNWAVIERRWPGLLGSLSLQKSDLPEHCLVTERESTLIVDGLHLTSKYDRESEATLQASLIPSSSRQTWVYGLALGDLPRVLLERPALQKLTVVILNPAVACLSLKYFDHGDWLNDPRVSLTLADSQQTMERPFAASPACLLLACEQSAPLRDRVFLELATPFIRRKHQPTPLLLERLDKNQQFIADDLDVSELFDSQQDNTIVVAAAGPTLSDHYTWLSAANRPPLIAVDAALKPLLRAGILPDFVVSIDAHPDLYKLFFQEVVPELPGNIPLIYFPVVNPEILAHWPGQRYTSYPDTPLYQQLSDRYPKAKLFSSGSVLHPAVDLAVQMGAGKVILAGADLSYPANQSHVTGCSVLSAPSGTGRHWVTNGFGEKVPTSLSFRGFLRDLEDYLVHQNKVTFINAGKKGAAIRHTSYLEETL